MLGICVPLGLLAGLSFCRALPVSSLALPLELKLFDIYSEYSGCIEVCIALWEWTECSDGSCDQGLELHAKFWICQGCWVDLLKL